MGIIRFLKRAKYAIIYKRGVHFPYSKIRIRALRKLGYKVGRDVYVAPDLQITMNYVGNHGDLRIGDRVAIGSYFTCKLFKGERSHERKKTFYYFA